jgi:dihydrodipicolinate synthase/N-acetylneuraminate lyase
MSFGSVIPAVITPFDGDLAVRPETLTANVLRLREHGIDHVIVCGTMGEAGALSEGEREVVIAAALEAGVRVSVGVSSADGPTAARRAKRAEALGAHGVMCLPPTGYVADQRELEAHFGAVAAASSLPMLLYNNPAAASQDLSAETIVGLAARHEEIVAVKECSEDARRIAQIVELSGEELDVLVGGDDWALEGYAAGAVGWVSGVANVAAAECVQLEAAVREGAMTRARELNQRLLPLSRLDMTPKLVQYFKAAIDLVGGYGGPSRPPRLALSDAEQEVVRAAVASVQRAAVTP